MRHIVLSLCAAAALSISGCAPSDEETVERAVDDLNAVDGNNLNDIMLTVADANEAVLYFTRAATQNPDRIDLQRGLARSLIRAGRPTEGVAAWRRVTEMPETANPDKVELADALIRAGEWKEAETVLDSIPPTYETFKRYRLEAMVADSNEEWEKADSFYETALGLTTSPAGVLNNWGFSKLTRGDFTAAERLFGDAIKQDRSLFTAKNNLVMARAAQRKYDLPLFSVTQTERAQLLHTMGLAAIKQGDVTIGQGLLREAIDTHPQYFEAAARSLEALEANVTN